MNRISLFALTLIASQLVGCGGGDGKPTAGDAPGVTVPATLWAAAAPADAKDIAAVKATAKEGDEVTIRGVIGGSENPFVAGRAMVALVDMSMPSCADNGESCPTPWDYCCVPQDEKAKAMATIQVVDDAGKPLKVSLDAGRRMEPYNVVIVRGKVGPRPSPEVLVINATSVFVESKTKMK